MRVFTTYFQRRYEAIDVEARCIDAMVVAVLRPNTTDAEHLERPIDTDKIPKAVRAGRPNKFPESGGIGLNFTT